MTEPDEEQRSERSRYQKYRDRRRGSPARTPQPCGTVAAARRHQRNNEALCDLCAAAWAEHQAAMYQRRKERKQGP